MVCSRKGREVGVVGRGGRRISKWAKWHTRKSLAKGFEFYSEGTGELLRDFTQRRD